MTPLQQAIRDADVENVRAMEAALRRCRTVDERQQCRDAYAWIAHVNHDVIGQRFGLSPLMTRPRYG